jgi:hypothetical protein
MAETKKKAQKKQEIIFIRYYAEPGALPVDLSKLFSVWADQVIGDKETRNLVVTVSATTGC